MTYLCYHCMKNITLYVVILCIFFAGKENMTFSEYLKSHRLTDNVKHYIGQAIAMATEATTTMEVSF